MSADRWSWHGGGLSAAQAHFGGDPASWLDLSTGINPHAWPGAQELAIDWRALPDEQALRRLEEAAAAHFGCAPAHVCAVPGTEVGLRLVGDLLPAPACHAVPSYRTHGEIVAGSTPVAFDMLARSPAATLILANPNNPDGRRSPAQDLLKLIESENARRWLLVDEAFADDDPAQSLAPWLADDVPLVIFRSFGKFFGLAGLRLGFVLGPRPLLARLRQRLGAWPVSNAALAIGTAAYGDRAWIAAMRTRLVNEATALDSMLLGRGYRVEGQCPLFRLVHCRNGRALFAHLAHRSILARPFDDQPDRLRLGLPGSLAALARLSAALPDNG